VRFADAEGAARWIRTLSVSNISSNYEPMFGQLTALATAELPPCERLRIAEVLREQIQLLHTELVRCYAGKPQPLAQPEKEAADQTIALWQALWQQYAMCRAPLIKGDPDLAAMKSRLLQRGLHVGKQLLLAYGLAHRSPPASLWQELHEYYLLSELLDCGDTALLDPLMPNGVGISCYSTYSHALLLGLADLCAMSVKQIQLTERWLQMWARKVHPHAERRWARRVHPHPERRATRGPLILVDLDSGEGATLSPTSAGRAGQSIRYSYPDKLANSIRGRLKRLQVGASPGDLRLGYDCGVDECASLLSYLDGCWCQPPKRPADGPQVVLQLCAGGLDGAFYRIGGRAFDHDSLKLLRGAQHLASLDPLSDFDRGKEEAEREWPWERWEGTSELNEAALVRKDPTHYHWRMDQLVIIGDGERDRASYVARVVCGEHGELAVTLRLWFGIPRALIARPASIAQSDNQPPVPALLLPETPDDKACLIVPSGTFNPSRVLRADDGGTERRFRLTRLLQRGVDFERFAFEEIK
jgi:hypothetical protein